MAIPMIGPTRRDVEEFNGITSSVLPKPAASPSAPPRPRVSAATPAAAPSQGSSSYGVTRPTAPIYPAATRIGRTAQAVTNAGSLPIDQSLPNLKRYGQAAEWLNAANMGPPLAGNRQPYETPKPFRPVFNPSVGDLGNDAALGPEPAKVTMPSLSQGAAGLAASAPAQPPVSSGPSILAGLPGLMSSGATLAGDVARESLKVVRPGATSVSGRKLGYGQMVDGVRTFSDGTGTVPRTMTDSQIADLAKGDRLTTYSSAGGLAFGPNGSVVGSAPTSATTGVSRLVAAALAPPTSPQGAAAPGNGVLSGANGYGVSRPTVDPVAVAAARARIAIDDAARNAQSDASSIATQDPRSPAGIAARNAALRVQYAPTRAARTAALDAQRALIAGVHGANQAAGEQISQVGIQGMRTSGELARAGIDADAGLARAGIDANAGIAQALIQRPRIGQTPVTLEDGTIAQFGEDGVARPIRTPEGLPVKPRRETLQPTRGDQYLKTVDSLAQRILGIDPISGKRADGGQPTAPEIEAAMLQARSIADQALGAPNPARPTPTLDQFMDGARKANPGISDAELQDYYRKTYGQ